MGQNAMVCVTCWRVCVSFGWMGEFYWVFGVDRWDTGVDGVCVVVV